MTDPEPRLTALALLEEMEDTLAAVQASDDEEVRLRLVEQMGVLLGGVSTLVEGDGEFTDDLSAFYDWADRAGVEVG